MADLRATAKKLHDKLNLIQKEISAKEAEIEDFGHSA